MGHLAAKQAYEKLRAKLDRFPVGAPGKTTIYEILRMVCSPEEAELLARIPWRFCTLRELSRRLGIPAAELEPRLNRLADRGLVFDIKLGGKMRYVLTPTVVGFFEFSMMRVRQDIDQAELARLFHRYMLEEPDFTGQFGKGLRTTPFRTLVHEDALPPDYAEVLDWERASHIVQEAGRWAVGLCHCRHVAHHLGEGCTRFEQESCLTIGDGVDFVVRHGFGREIGQAEACELLARSKEAGLVHLGDNVQRRPTFICSCCGCCCGVLNCFKKFKMFGNVFSSNFQAEVDPARCTGCLKCQQACPVDAIDRREQPRTVSGRTVKVLPVVDPDVCLGCGVCKLACTKDALHMAPRPQRRITPEGAFGRILRMALEQGKLHELLIEPEGLPAQAATVLLGAVLRLPPARQIIASEAFASRFIKLVIAGAKKAGIKGVEM